jgi:hypothetical protein
MCLPRSRVPDAQPIFCRYTGTHIALVTVMGPSDRHAPRDEASPFAACRPLAVTPTPGSRDYGPTVDHTLSMLTHADKLVTRNATGLAMDCARAQSRGWTCETSCRRHQWMWWIDLSRRIVGTLFKCALMLLISPRAYAMEGCPTLSKKAAGRDGQVWDFLGQATSPRCT